MDLFARLKCESLSHVIGGTRERIPVGVSLGIQPSLDLLLERVDRYLADYGSRLENVVSEETYRQRAMGGPGLPLIRVLRSDYALTFLGGQTEWVSYRDTFEVDGQPVRDRDERLLRLLTSGAVSQALQIDRLNAYLKKEVALEVGLAYTAVYQDVSDGDLGHGEAGDGDVFARWRLLGEEKSGWRGILGANAEGRHDFGDAAPRDLGDSFGSLWRTTNTFGVQEFDLIQLWWEQHLFDDKVVVTAGKMDPDNYYNTNRYQSDSTAFLSRAFSANPARFHPSNGLGANAKGKFLGDFYALVGFQDEVKAAFADPADAPRDPAEKRAAARLAVEWLRRLATGEVAGFDIKSAEQTLRDALRFDDLAEPAIDAVAQFKSPGAQQDLLNLALTPGRPPALRVKAADAVIRHIQAKFYEMVVDETGADVEYSIPYVRIVPILVEGGFDGYLSSEYEGNRHIQDAYPVDSVDQVRRQHAMFRRLLGDPVESTLVPA